VASAATRAVRRGHLNDLIQRLGTVGYAAGRQPDAEQVLGRYALIERSDDGSHSSLTLHEHAGSVIDWIAKQERELLLPPEPDSWNDYQGEPLALTWELVDLDSGLAEDPDFIIVLKGAPRARVSGLAG
jgi:hypothetical protein